MGPQPLKNKKLVESDDKNPKFDNCSTKRPRSGWVFRYGTTTIKEQKTNGKLGQKP